jgi:zinc transport system substrate-binding protein
VAVSVAPQAYFVQRLVGERVEVVVLLRPGAGEAGHEPGMRELRALARAVLLVRVGHPAFLFESTWLAPLLRDHPALRVVDAAPESAARASDPHVWVAPRHARAMAERIAAGLEAALPAEAESIRARLASVSAEIDALDAEIRALLAPHRGRRFFVVDPAFGTFAEDYGLVQVPLLPEHREPGARELARLVEAARAERARVLFVQPSFPREGAELVAADVGARLEPADPMAYDWSAGLRAFARAIAASFGA